MVFGKKVAIFNWEWSRNSAPREGQNMPCIVTSCYMIKASEHDNEMSISQTSQYNHVMSFFQEIIEIGISYIVMVFNMLVL